MISYVKSFSKVNQNSLMGTHYSRDDDDDDDDVISVASLI